MSEKNIGILTGIGLLILSVTMLFIKKNPEFITFAGSCIALFALPLEKILMKRRYLRFFIDAVYVFSVILFFSMQSMLHIAFIYPYIFAFLCLRTMLTFAIVKKANIRRIANPEFLFAPVRFIISLYLVYHLYLNLYVENIPSYFPDVYSYAVFNAYWF